MKKRSVVLAFALLITAGASAAHAQQPPQLFKWSGVYIGGSVDFIRVNGDTSFEPLPDAATFFSLQPTTIEMRDNGIGGRIFAGYGYRAAGFLIGFEGDYSFGRPSVAGEVSPIIRNDGSEFPGGGTLSATVDQKWLVTGRVRGGFTIARTLMYGTAGVAAASVDYTALADYPARQYSAEVSTNKYGWTWGVGVEFALSRWIFTRFEYRVIDLGDESEEAEGVPVDPGKSIKFTWQTKASDFSAALLIRF
jgi:opacity protein-like surface antigen